MNRRSRVFLHENRPASASALLAVMVAVVISSPGCSARAPDHLGGEAWPPCPSSPNCVSSLAAPSSPAWVAPLEVSGSLEAAWAAALEVIGSWPRTQVNRATDESIQAVVKSALFRFEDDLELRLNRPRGQIEVRSASRRGHSDMGVNRRRIESLRRELIELGVVRAEAPR